jgi:beta-phosphoglucomutase
MLRAIIFDFDGVIANSEPLHFQAYRDVLADYAFVLTERAYYDRYLGFDDVGAFEAIARDNGLSIGPADVRELVARKAVRLEALERDTSVLFPGAADAVRRASAALPIAIASGALGAEIGRVLSRERLAGCFAAIVAAEDAPRSKPAPDPYLRALTLLRTAIGTPTLHARHCVAIEDSRWGLASARAAGMRTVAVTNTYGKSAVADSADLVIPSLAAMDLNALGALCPERD